MIIKQNLIWCNIVIAGVITRIGKVYCMTVVIEKSIMAEVQNILEFIIVYCMINSMKAHICNI